MSGSLGWADALWLARRRTPNDRLRFWGSMLSSAIAAALLCTAFGLLTQLGTELDASIGVVAESGTRGGAAFAVLLVALPALHLTGQTWKLGSIERRARMRQLRDAGAGPRDLRRVAVADTGVPVLIGALAGVVLLGVALALLNARGTYVQGWVDTPDGRAVPSRHLCLDPDAARRTQRRHGELVARAARHHRRGHGRSRRRRSRRGWRRRPGEPPPRPRVAERAARAVAPAVPTCCSPCADSPTSPAPRPALRCCSAWQRSSPVPRPGSSRQYRLSMGQTWLEDDFFCSRST